MKRITICLSAILSVLMFASCMGTQSSNAIVANLPE